MSARASELDRALSACEGAAAAEPQVGAGRSLIRLTVRTTAEQRTPSSLATSASAVSEDTPAALTQPAWKAMLSSASVGSIGPWNDRNEPERTPATLPAPVLSSDAMRRL